jgi:uncharacterized protein YqhQ
MMLTPLAAAIAREAPGGGFQIESFSLPHRQQHALEKLPFVRILPKLIGQMALVVRGWKPKKTGVPIPLIAVAVVIGALSLGINFVLVQLPPVWRASSSSILQLGLFFLFIGATRLSPQFGRIWRFHGGEHQAIATYESGMELTVQNAQTRTLYHARCGTNFAILAILLMVPGMVLSSQISGTIGYFITLAVPLPALCIAFEMVMLGQKRLRAVLWPGLLFQRLTVARPGPRESMAGIVALQAALAEHEKVEALRLAVAPTEELTTRLGARSA